MKRRFALAAGVTVATAGLVAAMAIPGFASDGPVVAQAAPNAAAADVPAQMLTAVARDLGVSEAQARQRLITDDQNTRTGHALAKALGNSYAGSWIEGSKLVVAVTSKSQAAVVKGAGAEAKVVAHSAQYLDAQKAKLDAKVGTQSQEHIAGWYVDPESNRVVVNALAGHEAQAATVIKAAGLDAATVDIVKTAERPQTMIDVIGGNAYNMAGGGRCSVGFSVTNGGFITAGHCGRQGTSTSNPSGSFARSNFPGADMAYVQVSAGNTMRPLVNNYAGGTLQVAGSQEAAIGATVCRSGSTTGYHCGRILAKGSSISYQEGTVTGLIRTNVCADRGDSGGSLLAGNQAQGVTSGGSGLGCPSGNPDTYFYPVTTILSSYGLTLMTQGGSTPPPTSNPPTSRPPTSNPPTTSPGCGNAPGWSSGAIYNNGDRVAYNGRLWQAKWWTQGEAPGSTGQWGVWTDLGPCSGGGNPPPTSNPPTSNPPTSNPPTSNPPGNPGNTWQVGKVYSAGDVVSYNGSNYRCLQGHTAQQGWDPATVPALWQRI